MDIVARKDDTTSTLPELGGETQIRLLHLQPASQETDPIFCHFSVVSVDDCEDEDLTPYEALSYVWGVDKHAIPAYVNGSPTEVTTNLYHALQHLRLVDRERTIWIDAICIDQKNLAERSQQVSIMGCIYERAENVVIWLGKSWDSCDLTMRYLERMALDCSLHIHPALSPSLHVDGKDIMSAEIQEGLRIFFGALWWTRVWTCQEYPIAKRCVFQCGRSILEGHLAHQGTDNYYFHINRCCVYLRSHEPSHDVSDWFQKLASLESVRTDLQNLSLPHIISHFRQGRDATDLRDKLFGFLGLAKGRYKDIILPDYTLSTERKFTIASLKMIQETGSLEVLSHIPIAGERNLNLPSYVPDWTVVPKNDHTYSCWLGRLQRLNLFDACKGEIAEAIEITSDQIALRGLFVDEIQVIGSVKDSISRSDFLDEMAGLAIDFVHFGRDWNAGKRSLRSKLWEAICGSTEYDLDPDQDDRRYWRRLPTPDTFDKFEKWATWHSLSPPEIGEMDLEIKSIYLAFETVSVGRRFAVTNKGRLAWCPVMAKPTDVVVVLAGASVPFVLRPQAEGRYTVVGDAYVHGIMDGEALADDEGPKAFTFIELV